MERIVVPVHFGKRQRRTGSVIPRSMPWVTNKAEGTMCAAGALKIRTAMAHAFYVIMHPQKALLGCRRPSPSCTPRSTRCTVESLTRKLKPILRCGDL